MGLCSAFDDFYCILQNSTEYIFYYVQVYINIDLHTRVRFSSTSIQITMNDKQHNANSAEEHSVFYAATQALRRHASGGNILIAATLCALVIANIPGLNNYYFDFWQNEIRLQLGDFNIFSHSGEPMDLIAFINDALMAIFFFSIGLEIKREILVGELSSFKQALLPIVAAIGGMLLPVGIYFCFAKGTDFADGAAIPMATDIAFSLGVLTM